MKMYQKFMLAVTGILVLSIVGCEDGGSSSITNQLTSKQTEEQQAYFDLFFKYDSNDSTADKLFKSASPASDPSCSIRSELGSLGAGAVATDIAKNVATAAGCPTCAAGIGIVSDIFKVTKLFLPSKPSPEQEILGDLDNIQKQLNNIEDEITTLTNDVYKSTNEIIDDINTSSDVSISIKYDAVSENIIKKFEQLIENNLLTKDSNGDYIISQPDAYYDAMIQGDDIALFTYLDYLSGINSNSYNADNIDSVYTNIAKEPNDNSEIIKETIDTIDNHLINVSSPIYLILDKKYSDFYSDLERNGLSGGSLIQKIEDHNKFILQQIINNMDLLQYLYTLTVVGLMEKHIAPLDSEMAKWLPVFPGYDSDNDITTNIDRYNKYWVSSAAVLLRISAKYLIADGDEITQRDCRNYKDPRTTIFKRANTLPSLPSGDWQQTCNIYRPNFMKNDFDGTWDENTITMSCLNITKKSNGECLDGDGQFSTITRTNDINYGDCQGDLNVNYLPQSSYIPSPRAIGYCTDSIQGTGAINSDRGDSFEMYTTCHGGCSDCWLAFKYNTDRFIEKDRFTYTSNGTFTDYSCDLGGGTIGFAASHPEVDYKEYDDDHGHYMPGLLLHTTTTGTAIFVGGKLWWHDEGAFYQDSAHMDPILSCSTSACYKVSNIQACVNTDLVTLTSTDRSDAYVDMIPDGCLQ
jgi:hypothetical protein